MISLTPISNTSAVSKDVAVGRIAVEESPMCFLSLVVYVERYGRVSNRIDSRSALSCLNHRLDDCSLPFYPNIFDSRVEFCASASRVFRPFLLRGSSTVLSRSFGNTAANFSVSRTARLEIGRNWKEAASPASIGNDNTNHEFRIDCSEFSYRLGKMQQQQLLLDYKLFNNSTLQLDRNNNVQQTNW